MRMRTFALLGLLGASFSIATASFDLMLLNRYDASTNFSRIHRYDPVSGAYLGSFASGIQVTRIAVNPTNSEVYAYDSNNSTIRAYNYNTGAFLRSYFASTGITDMVVSNDGTTILHSTGSTVIRGMDLTTGAYSNLVTGTGTTGFYRLALHRNGTLYAAGDTVSLSQFAPSGSNYVQIQVTTLSGVSSASAATQMAVQYPDVGSSLGYVAIGQGSSFGYNYFGSTGNLLNIGGTQPAGQISSMSVMLNSHAGYYGLGVDLLNSSQVRLNSYDVAGVPIETKILPFQIGNPNAGAIVLAPEPGTMIALAAGIGVLARRRRKK
jgi:hypothetical protein